MSCECVILLLSRCQSTDLRPKAVEVASPNATFELTIKTAMGKGITVPKGRYTLPREAKSKSQDRILVFAEGQIADDAKAAGADIVGGPELIDGVSMHVCHISSQLMYVLCSTGDQWYT